jgi:hypothetical protein
VENAEAKKAEIEKEETLKPPFTVMWRGMCLFFELIRTRQFDVFNRERIELNIIKGSGANPFFTGIRFLGLVEADGKATEKFESLRRTGDDKT